jgi:hypothetical protein
VAINIFLQKLINLASQLLIPTSFCLQEVLKQSDICYFLNKNSENTKLMLYTDGTDKLALVEKNLKTYDINAKILPYKEEKEWKKVQ